MIIDPYTWHRLVVEQKANIAEDTIAIRMLRPKDYVFRAGQYAVVRVTKADGNQLIRQYSFSSAPHDATIELLVQRQPSGEVSNWLIDELTPGDSIELSQPFGNFTIDKGSKRPHLFIAGRIGIAPFISILRETRRRHFSVLYSVRHPEQTCYPELLETVSTSVIYTDTSPRISKKELLPTLDQKPVIYVCGSKQFVDAICTVLSQCGVERTDIKRELFTLQ